MYGGAMEERIEVVALACHGTVVNWRDSVEAVAYRVARMHGESPLDRGRALRLRLEALQATGSFADAYEQWARECGYRWAGAGEAAFRSAVAGCRRFPDAAPALESARAAGLRVVAVSRAEPRLLEAALRPLDGAFDEILGGRDLAGAAKAIGIPPQRVLHVTTGGAGLRAAGALGMRAAWLNRSAAPPPEQARYDFEWRSLRGLATWVAEPRTVAAAP
jgi:FMN phosphatase YigB (HAD superfamily)